jgi:hypothetical protein
VYRGAIAAADASAETSETAIEAETLLEATLDGEETTVILDSPETGKNWLYLPLIAN